MDSALGASSDSRLCRSSESLAYARSCESATMSPPGFPAVRPRHADNRGAAERPRTYERAARVPRAQRVLRTK
jgi:hypothetical protein